MTNYNDGFWHGWNGGECPVHPRSVVEIVYQDDGVYHSSEAIASHCDWDNEFSYPIIAFRVVKEHKVPREFWIVGGAAYDSFEDALDDNLYHEEIIHVREVLE